MSYRSSFVAIAIPLIILLLLFKKSLRGTYVFASPSRIVDPIFTTTAAGACLLFALLVLIDVSATRASLISAGVVSAGAFFRDRTKLRMRLIPWNLLLLVTALFVGVDLLNQYGIEQEMSHLTHTAVGTLLWSSLMANLINNLPAYLIFEGAVTSHNLFFLLIGVNFGSIILPWGSLATLLWAQRCKAAGVEVMWKRTILISGLMAVAVLPLAALSTRS